MWFLLVWASIVTTNTVSLICLTTWWSPLTFSAGQYHHLPEWTTRMCHPLCILWPHQHPLWQVSCWPMVLRHQHLWPPQTCSPHTSLISRGFHHQSRGALPRNAKQALSIPYHNIRLAILNQLNHFDMVSINKISPHVVYKFFLGLLRCAQNFNIIVGQLTGIIVVQQAATYVTIPCLYVCSG